jgi:hypothetical protein
MMLNRTWPVHKFRYDARLFANLHILHEAVCVPKMETRNIKTLTPWSTVHENMTVIQLVKIFHAYYSSRRFNTMCSPPMSQLNTIQTVSFYAFVSFIRCLSRVNESTSDTLLNIRNMLVFTVSSFSSTSNPKAGGPHFVGYPWLLLQYILSYPSHLEVTSIRNLRTCRMAVTGEERVPAPIWTFNFSSWMAN